MMNWSPSDTSISATRPGRPWRARLRTRARKRRGWREVSVSQMRRYWGHSGPRELEIGLWGELLSLRTHLMLPTSRTRAATIPRILVMTMQRLRSVLRGSTSISRNTRHTVL